MHPWLAIQAAWRYHAKLTSPNSGWSEAACAGALRVRLVGPLCYHGELVPYEFLGDPDWSTDLDAADLRRALRLILCCCVLALAAGLAVAPLRLSLPW